MNLSEAFLYQARACASLGSPFMDQLLRLLADHWPVDSALGQICADWPGEIGPNGASLPLRIAGGLHALVLTGREPALGAVYPPATVDGQSLLSAVLAALDRHQNFLLDWITNAPQTNEVRRSAALIPATHWLAARFPLPVMLSELGASAGLNLMFDRFALAAGGTTLGPRDPALTLHPEWRGPVPAAASVQIASRMGVDLNPLDAHKPDHALRLMAYIWPDQPHRTELTRAAIAVLDAPLVKADAVDWLARRLSQQPDGQLHLIYHTIAWQYFPQNRQQTGQALIEAAGARATPSRPLAWLRMEHDGDSAGKSGAALTLRFWPGDQYMDLGRVDFHGRWVEWHAD